MGSLHSGNPPGSNQQNNMQTTTAPISPPGNLFTDMLARHRKGIAADKASRLLSEAITASRDTGAKSEVTLKVTLHPGTDDQMRVEIQVAHKLPQEKLPGALFWVTDEGTLATSDPRQPELPLREVVREATPTREVKIS
jgi:hypothetical protein